MSVPDRYSTEVTVEVYTYKTSIDYFHFSDIQLAYLWIQKICKPSLSFTETCDKLDDAYNRKGKGTRVTVFEDILNTFNIYYYKFDGLSEINEYRSKFLTLAG
jgi:hypothetical protein